MTTGNSSFGCDTAHSDDTGVNSLSATVASIQVTAVQAVPETTSMAPSGRFEADLSAFFVDFNNQPVSSKPLTCE